MKLTDEQQNWFGRVRAEWQEKMRPGDRPMGAHLFGEPAVLPDAAMEGARLFATRTVALAALPKGGVVAEVGTQTGRFARSILDACGPAALHLFDLEFDTLRRASPDVAADPRVTLHLGDSSTELDRLPDQSFAWLYIDGDHSREGIQRDADCAARKVERDGVLVFNDYTVWSPMELTDYGTVPVVNAMLASGEWQVVYLALHPLMYCDIAIRRRP